MFKKLFPKKSISKPESTKAYPRGYNNKELEKLIDKYGDLNPDKFNVGPSYFSKATLGLTELGRRTATELGWWTLSISILALLFSFLAVKYAAEQTEFTEIQSRSDRILQMQAIQEARKECEQSPELNGSKLFDTSNGNRVSCKEVLRVYGSGNSTWSRIKKIFIN